MKPKYYAVRRGRAPGIYTTWEETLAQVSGFPGAVYKGFFTRQDAEDFLAGKTPVSTPTPVSSSRPPVEQPGLFSAPLPVDADDPQTAGWKTATLFTDGGCISNPGPGGWGAVLVSGAGRKELSGGFRLTTNNRMELMACIAGLEALKEPCRVTLIADSRYVINGLSSGSARRWQHQGWINHGRSVPNADLWARLLAAAAQHALRFEWIRGHTGHPENERCDALATAAALRPDLPVDPGYETV
ncbi:MAG TPA: ribonuclease HI [Anaerolineaceae bacterium]